MQLYMEADIPLPDEGRLMEKSTSPDPDRSRVSYRDAGAATRQALQRAANASPRLNGTDYRTLGAVLALTTTYSKLEAETYLAGISSLACLNVEDRRRVAKSLKVLRGHGIIEYSPRMHRAKDVWTVVGIPAAPVPA